MQMKAMESLAILRRLSRRLLRPTQDIKAAQGAVYQTKMDIVGIDTPKMDLV